MKMYSLQNAEEVAGFSSIPPIYTNQTKIAAYYFDLLMRTKDMLKKAISTAPEADRSHYDLLIFPALSFRCTVHFVSCGI